MTNHASSDDWSKDPALSGIDPAKLQALQSLARNSQGKSQSEMLPFLLSLMQRPGKNGTQFSPSEAELILSAIKAGKSPKEAARIDQMVQLFRSGRPRKK